MASRAWRCPHDAVQGTGHARGARACAAWRRAVSAYAALLVAHVLGATIWTGGHLVLALGVLPAALRARDPGPVQRFEAQFERLGLPALALQVATGLALAHALLPSPAAVFDGSPTGRLVATKLVLLVLTVVLATHARLVILPRLDAARLPLLAAHIVAVTLLSAGFVAAGLGLRIGLFG